MSRVAARVQSRGLGLDRVRSRGIDFRVGAKRKGLREGDLPSSILVVVTVVTRPAR